MRISKRPIDPHNMDLLAMVTETFEAIAADPTIALEVIEQVAYLSQTRDDEDEEIMSDRSEILDCLVENVAEAMYENYYRECAAADAYNSRAETIAALASATAVKIRKGERK